MKKAITLLAFALLPCATRGLAADGPVPAAVLQRLGLGNLQLLSDEQGTQVRGSGGNAITKGLSLATGFVIDQSTNSFVSGTDAHVVTSTAENAGAWDWTRALSGHQSAFNLNLGVSSANGAFTGVLVGGAGGNACASTR